MITLLMERVNTFADFAVLLGGTVKPESGTR